MEQISGLVWETERPYWYRLRQSPNFWLLGYEWNFSFQCVRAAINEDSYKITLHKFGDNTPLDKDVCVMVYIRSNIPNRCRYVASRLRSSGQVVWIESVTSVNSALGCSNVYGTWTITFLFLSDQPLKLHLSRNDESELSSSQLSKAILSEDKCVQACFDIPPDMESLSHDLHQLLERNILPDVKLRCGDRNICAHRSILSARSDVFNAMFRNEMSESETGIVHVTDVDFDVLNLLLQYVYSGKIQDMSDDIASSLYEVGDKYSIRSLKKCCSDWMVGNLAVENCLGFLVLADAHSDEDFKEIVLNFVAENLESIKKCAWAKFNKDHPLLANSVYQKHLSPTLSKQA